MAALSPPRQLPTCERLSDSHITSSRHGGTSCQCGATLTLPEIKSLSLDDNATSWWGLPTATCSGGWTQFWTDEYPKLHAQWRAANRIVVHCSIHTGFGNWLGGVSAALAYSIVTEQALSLRCDDERIMKKEAGHVVRLHEGLARYFHSPHFDWDFDAPPHEGPSKERRTVDLTAFSMNPAHWAFNATGPTRVLTTHSVHARRTLLVSRSKTGWPRFFRTAADVESMLKRDDHHLTGCLLRYLFAPTNTLERAVHQATGMAVQPGRLMPVAVAHIRTGDSNFMSAAAAPVAAAASATKANADESAGGSGAVGSAPHGRRLRGERAWQFHDEWMRGGLQLLQMHEAAPLECLERLSASGAAASGIAASSGGGPAVTTSKPAPATSGDAAAPAAPAAGASSACMPCVLLTDSPWMEQCSSQLFGRSLATPGVAVHLGASSANATADVANVQRLFVDWFLLATSAASIRMSPGSTFSVMSSAYWKATAPLDIAETPSNAKRSHRGSIDGVWPHLAVHEAFLPFNRSEVAWGRAEVDQWWRAQCNADATL